MGWMNRFFWNSGNEGMGRQLSISLIVACLVFSINAHAADTLITPDNPAINYYGRFDFSNPVAPRFNWSGSTIEFTLSGSPTVQVNMSA